MWLRDEIRQDKLLFGIITLTRQQYVEALKQVKMGSKDYIFDHDLSR